MASWGTIYNNTIYGVQNHAGRLTRIQEQVSTGSRVIRSSDDPADAHRIMSLQDYMDLMDNYDSNITSVELTLNEAYNAVDSMSDLFTRVGVLMTQAASGTYMENNRKAMGEEIDTILEEVVSLANHSVLGRYVFGGADSFNQPYIATRENGKITGVEYYGSYSEQPVPIGPGVTLSGQMVGETIFRNDQREDPEFYGDTGATAGTATSNALGDVWLTIEHLSTTYDLGTLSAGTSSADGDTILGNNHTVSIEATGGAGRIRLDNGTWVDFDGSENDLLVLNEDGDAAYLDVTALTNENGTYSISTTGQMSIDGNTVVTTDFTDSNLAVPSDDDGRLLYVQTKGIARTGVDAVRVPGTYDIFTTLIEARDMLLNTQDLGVDDQMDALSRIAESVTEISDGFRQRMTVIGGRQGSVDTMREIVDNLRYNAEAEATAIQEADVVQLATDLAREETLYGMSLTIASKVLQLSLMDYIL